MNSGSLKCSPPLTVAISQTAQPLQPWKFGFSPLACPLQRSGFVSLLWAPCHLLKWCWHRLALISRKGHRSGPLVLGFGEHSRPEQKQRTGGNHHFFDLAGFCCWDYDSLFCVPMQRCWRCPLTSGLLSPWLCALSRFFHQPYIHLPAHLLLSRAEQFLGS